MKLLGVKMTIKNIIIIILIVVGSVSLLKIICLKLAYVRYFQ